MTQGTDNLGRFSMFDGIIHISGGLNLTPGVMVKAKAQAALGPDLYADFVWLADPDLSGINPIGSSA